MSHTMSFNNRVWDDLITLVAPYLYFPYRLRLICKSPMLDAWLRNNVIFVPITDDPQDIPEGIIDKLTILDHNHINDTNALQKYPVYKSEYFNNINKQVIDWIYVNRYYLYEKDRVLAKRALNIKFSKHYLSMLGNPHVVKSLLTKGMDMDHIVRTGCDAVILLRAAHYDDPLPSRYYSDSSVCILIDVLLGLQDPRLKDVIKALLPQHDELRNIVLNQLFHRSRFILRNYTYWFGFPFTGKITIDILRARINEIIQLVGMSRPSITTLDIDRKVYRSRMMTHQQTLDYIQSLCDAAKTQRDIYLRRTLTMFTDLCNTYVYDSLANKYGLTTEIDSQKYVFRRGIYFKYEPYNPGHICELFDKMIEYNNIVNPNDKDRQENTLINLLYHTRGGPTQLHIAHDPVVYNHYVRWATIKGLRIRNKQDTNIAYFHSCIDLARHCERYRQGLTTKKLRPDDYEELIEDDPVMVNAIMTEYTECFSGDIVPDTNKYCIGYSSQYYNSNSEQVYIE